MTGTALTYDDPDLPSRPGRPRAIRDAEELYRWFEKYEKWIHANPLIRYKTAVYNGVACKLMEPLMRAPTQAGFCRFMGISPNSWMRYKTWPQHEDLHEAIAEIESAMADDRFTGAAAGLLNAHLISRDLGLVDRQQVEARNFNTEGMKDITPAEANACYLHPDDLDGTGPRLTYDQWQAAKNGELPLERLTD